MEAISEDPALSLGVIRVAAAKHPDQMLFLSLASRDRPFHPLLQ